MNWFFIALASPFLWSLCNHIDKYLIGNYYKNVRAGALMFLTAFTSLIFSLAILVFNHHVLHLAFGSAVLIITAGVIYFAANFPYIYALKRDEASRVVPLFQVIPIFSYALALVFLHEQLHASQIAAGTVIICGAVLINLDLDNKFRLKKDVFGLMMLSSGLFAIEGLVFKFVALDAGFWRTAFYQYLGTALGGFMLLVGSKPYRQDFMKVIGNNPRTIFSISLLNESFNVMARICANYASLLAPLALVSLVNGFQAFFVVIIGVLLTVFWPALGEESLLRKHVLQKTLSVIVIFSGTYLLFR